MLDVSAAHVAAARRKLAQSSFRDFCCLVDIPAIPADGDEDQDALGVMRLDQLAPHHDLLGEKLEGIEAWAAAVETKKQPPPHAIPNLMVLMPPGSAKSTYADVLFIPWFMAKRPRRPVILASYGSDLAGKQGKKARTLADSDSYRALMGAGLKPGNRAVDEWGLTNGSDFMSGGLLSGITGNRAALGVLDDPLKGREAAESKTIRDKVWEEYIDAFCTRLKPGAPQVMILTRWHQDDPAGRILPEKWSGESGWIEGRDGRRWYVLCIPAIADREDDPLGRSAGETLWPEYFQNEGNPLAYWAPFQLIHRTWTSMFQQKPTAEEGTYFLTKWFRRYKPEERPANLRIYATSDHAPGGGAGHDFNVFRVWGIDADRHIWLLDGYRAQGTIDKLVGVQLDERTGTATLALEGALPLIKKWKPLCWFPEDDNNWKSAAPFVRSYMRQLRVPCRIEPLSTGGGDKATKAQAFQAKAAMGEVHIPEGAEGEAVLDQYKAFPGGRWDDEIDAAANIGRALDEAHPAITPFSEKRRSSREDYGADEGDGDGDWRTV